MKRSRHTGLVVTTAIIAALALGAISGGTPAVAVESGLSERFSANLHGDVITVGNSIPACPKDGGCPHTSSAVVSVPAGATIAHARLHWAVGLGEGCVPARPVTDPRLGFAGAASAVAGNAGGAHTAEAEVTGLLRSLPDDAETTVTVDGIRADACAAGWSLTIAYKLPGERADDGDKRHISIYSGASMPPDTGLIMDGFRRAGDRPPRLTATAYGDARLRVNDTELATTPASHIRGARLPAGTIAEGDTSAAIDFQGDDFLVQQVALSVPVADDRPGPKQKPAPEPDPKPELRFSAAAIPRQIGPGDTVVHTVTAGNRGGRDIDDAAFRVDLSEALDDATRPFSVEASRGDAVFAGKSLRWTGTVPAHGEVTLTYSMTIKNPRPGDGRLQSTVIGNPATNCAAGSTEAACRVQLRFPPRPHSGTTGSALPPTGASLTAVTTFAVTAVLGGAALLIAARRRQH